MEGLNNTQLSYIENKIKSILFTRFSSGPRINVVKHRDRFNFACPYCGDSSEDDSKKSVS